MYQAKFTLKYLFPLNFIQFKFFAETSQNSAGTSKHKIVLDVLVLDVLVLDVLVLHVLAGDLWRAHYYLSH